MKKVFLFFYSFLKKKNKLFLKITLIINIYNYLMLLILKNFYLLNTLIDLFKYSNHFNIFNFLFLFIKILYFFFLFYLYLLLKLFVF
ncbi:hypothetical protein NASALF_039 [Candidatus Nasuia deltocephalinicola str. NAS-ALF]|uniref:Uncharacterized protein n=1 Tax=Candidatus Nasuia deltocephalinicola str. NAS-ALF TaxID=1343077 RepID=S5TEU2_9PROT|nr:hypothetical protein NASALF_039 [Candidatus Nasuia deltocephalinicola str. NAS-ALF]